MNHTIDDPQCSSEAEASATQDTRAAALLAGLWAFITFDVVVTLLAASGSSIAGGVAVVTCRMLLKWVAALLDAASPARASAAAPASWLPGLPAWMR